MFDLVADVEKYPEFMPWCGGAEVQTRDEHGMQASILISFAGMKQRFTTRNTHVYPDRIDLRLVDGPFSSLVGHWEFQPLAEDACKVLFTMEYAFSNGRWKWWWGRYSTASPPASSIPSPSARRPSMANEDIGVSVCHALPDQVWVRAGRRDGGRGHRGQRVRRRFSPQRPLAGRRGRVRARSGRIRP